jgi:hypothetical protein
MARSIVTAASTAGSVRARSGPGSETTTATTVDGYSDMLLKLIPAEVIGIYLAMQTILNNASEVSEHTALVVFLFGVTATYFYLRVTLKVTNLAQLLVSVGAFCVWAYSMSSVEQLSWYNGTYAGLLLVAYTFIAPKIPMGEKS